MEYENNKNNAINEKYKSLSLKNYKDCMDCSILPICNGPCIQKMFELETSDNIEFKDICLLSRYSSLDDYLRKHIKLVHK